MIWGWFRSQLHNTELLSCQVTVLFIPVRCSQVTRVTWEHLTGMKSTVTWYNSNSVLYNLDLNHPQIIFHLQEFLTHLVLPRNSNLVIKTKFANCWNKNDITTNYAWRGVLTIHTSIKNKCWNWSKLLFQNYTRVKVRLTNTAKVDWEIF